MELDSTETLNLLLNNILLYSATRQDVQIWDLVSVIYGAADDAACYTRSNAVLSFRNGGRK